MSTAKSLNSRVLSVQEIEEMKQSLKARFQKSILHPKQEMSFLLEEIDSRSSFLKPVECIETFLLILSALNLHEKYGGLKTIQIDRLLNLAKALLKLLEVSRTKSRYVALYRDLLLVQSQLARNAGQHWNSLWKYHLAEYYDCGQAIEREKSQRVLNMGTRYLRLGFGDLAEKCFKQIIESSSSVFDDRIQGHLELIRRYRLGFRLDEAEDLIREAKSLLNNLSAEQDLELEWEAAWVHALRQNDHSVLIEKTIARKSSHYQTKYIFQGILIAYACESRRWVKRFPKIESLYRSPQFQIRRKDILYRSCQTLEFLYEPGIAMSSKLEQLETLFEDRSKLQSISEELIFYVAILRWLIRFHHYPLAAPLLQQYQSLSLQVSEGKTNDALSLARGLTAMNWYRSL